MKKILIVDKSNDSISDLYELLDPLYDLSACTSSMEALALARKHSYDLFLIETVLPQMDGFQLLAKIRESEMNKTSPVIMSGLELAGEQVNRGYFLGANEFISKPYQKQMLLRRISDQLTMTDTASDHWELERHKTEETLENMYRMLENLCEVIESKDYVSGVHIMRSGHYYKILVRELLKNSNIRKNFMDIDIESLVMAAEMHDIGKIATPDSILNKPGSLTRFEFETMKNHSYNGYHILKRMEERQKNNSVLKYGEDIALSHHEKWNGKGYPRRLKDNEIPLAARIMSVVDVYDALTSDKIYKKSVTHEEAMEIIKRERGESFDPEVVDAFLAVQDRIFDTYKAYRDMDSVHHEEGKAKDLENCHILLVESDPIVREIIGSQLKNHGFRITYSASGMDAIYILKNRDVGISCVITDLEIPDMDAYEFVELLRKTDDEVLAICVTDKDYSLNSIKANRLGFDACFLKPLDCELFLYRFKMMKKKRAKVVV